MKSPYNNIKIHIAGVKVKFNTRLITRIAIRRIYYFQPRILVRTESSLNRKTIVVYLDEVANKLYSLIPASGW